MRYRPSPTRRGYTISGPVILRGSMYGGYLDTMNTFPYRHRKALIALAVIALPLLAQALLRDGGAGNWTTSLAAALSLASFLYLISYTFLLNERLIVSGHTLTVARHIGRSRKIDLHAVKRMVLWEIPGSIGVGKTVNMHLHLDAQTIRIELSHLRNPPEFVRLIESKLRQGGLQLAPRTLDDRESLSLKQLDELLG